MRPATAAGFAGAAVGDSYRPWAAGGGHGGGMFVPRVCNEYVNIYRFEYTYLSKSQLDLSEPLGINFRT